MTVRTRYAPSPTGAPQLGNIRTALFGWLFARGSDGTFILRIEDTDQARAVEGGIQQQYEALRWLGLNWDEGPDVGGPHAPYVQSQRLDLYRQAAERLVAEGNAYPCFCTVQRLDDLRKQQVAAKQPPGYDRLCRGLSAEERERRLSAGESHVIRFAVPLSGEVTFHDLIRGDVTVQNGTLDDFVIIKSDGYPTYHLAVVVDDHAMEITHVLRGEEWLPSAPRHQLLHKALGIEPPVFVHMSVILGPDRKKLSKRLGATSVLEYRDAGYLPEAIINFLALIGWSLDDKTEIINRQQLLENFRLEDISPSPGILDSEKLRWMNGEYIRALPEDDLAERILPFLLEELPETARKPDLEFVKRIVPLIQTRIEVLTDVWNLTAFFFTEDVFLAPGDLLGKRFQDDQAAALMALQTAERKLAELDSWTATVIEEALRALGDELGLKPRDFFGLIRMGVTGSAVSPPLFESLEVLGREPTLERLASAREVLS
ncbi:MAG TPA: glutamate--tRNA ligase [Dehalococcoidia bacterium]|nr:glutamate--tRNA ligase [Dehalococcoidia bacterium]